MAAWGRDRSDALNARAAAPTGAGPGRSYLSPALALNTAESAADRATVHSSGDGRELGGRPTGTEFHRQGGSADYERRPAAPGGVRCEPSRRALSVRHSLGEEPVCRLNARLKLAIDP